MPVLTPIHEVPSTAPAGPGPDGSGASGPVCSLQRVAPQGAPGKSSSLWQLGIEAQDLTAAIAQLAEQLEAEEEDTRNRALAELETALLAEEGNRQALPAKADATCWVIEHLRGQAAYRQQQARRLTDLARSDAGRADALEQSLVLVLTRLQPGTTRFSFPNHKLTSRRSEAVEIADLEALDPQWLMFKTSAQPDKAAIKSALKSGQQITGAQLLCRRSWRIT
ncbi:siphovirus Gp157 family protein [Cyanobium sp. ATX 6A2]|uniref:siphovirus Gp157 family protein n=1 Tax=Cyanobium sp. ATX 6A2 TaxID=2823700 RepID=UPI0020CE8553|nr:siphovirus Gp157 family protein [Cyanobium sp. ATX 6A2]MCP9889270.1 siphovirus Gp157 family protein [Cyanobium sp. ATX 6A2]